MQLKEKGLFMVNLELKILEKLEVPYYVSNSTKLIWFGEVKNCDVIIWYYWPSNFVFNIRIVIMQLASLVTFKFYH